MRLLALVLILSPGAALAHLGHIADAAGHDHWIAGAAIGIAVTIGLYSAWKDRKRGQDAEPEQDTDAEETPA
jgi:hypothetical protein